MEGQKLNKILIMSDPYANLNTPVAVDMVILYQADLIDKFLKMPARTYFKTKSQMLLDYPNSIKVRSFEIIPDQTFEVETEIKEKEVAAIFVFADYLTPGQHRIRLPYEKNVAIHLLKETITTTELGAKK